MSKEQIEFRVDDVFKSTEANSDPASVRVVASIDCGYVDGDFIVDDEFGHKFDVKFCTLLHRPFKTTANAVTDGMGGQLWFGLDCHNLKAQEIGHRQSVADINWERDELHRHHDNDIKALLDSDRYSIIALYAFNNCRCDFYTECVVYRHHGSLKIEFNHTAVVYFRGKIYEMGK